jgi:hypothetical protein
LKCLDILSKNHERLFDTSKFKKENKFLFKSSFDLVAAQEYVLLGCQVNQTGGFTDRPKISGR